MKTYFDLEKWENENRDRIGLYYRTRPIMPDGYDWRAAIDKATKTILEHAGSWTKPKDMNLWRQELPQMVQPADVWEFFDYPEFEDVVKHRRIKTWSLDPLKEFPAAFDSWPIWGVTDVTVFPSQFNNMKTELDPHGIPYNLMRWWAVVTPRTARLKSHLGRSYLYAGSSTTWQRMREAIAYDLGVWSANSKPRN